jgi:hypothetical protein
MLLVAQLVDRLQQGVGVVVFGAERAQPLAERALLRVEERLERIPRRVADQLDTSKNLGESDVI